MDKELKNVLTPEEVEALQKAISSGQVNTEGEEELSAAEYGLCDFSRYQDHTFMHLPALDRICDRFGKTLRATFLTRLGIPFSVTIASLGAMSFKKFLASLPHPTCLFLFSVAPPGEPALLIMEAKQVHFFIDRLCGGNGEQTTNMDLGEFQEIGQSLVRRFALQLLEDLAKAWSAVSTAKIKLEGIYLDPNYFDATSPEEFQGAPVRVMSIEMKSDPSSGNLYICFPRATLQALFTDSRKKAGEETSKAQPAWTSAVKDNLCGASVNLSVELGNGGLNLRELLSLSIGDVIQLDKGPADELPVKVEGIEKFRGHPGRYRGHMALQVTAPINGGGKKYDGRPPGN